MRLLTLFLFIFQVSVVMAENPTPTLPTATQALLDGVKSTQSKSVIKSVLMIACPKDNMKGTGFVISGGTIITTNSHVVGSCKAEELVGYSAATNDPVQFTSLERDVDRDLATLCVKKALPYSLKLDAAEKNPPVETDVETWGYPLKYQELAPLLSRGYVAGYTTERTPLGQTPVKQLVINGAINPGNSGGPLIDRATGRVIGVIVSKWTLWSPNIETAIKGWAHPRSSMGGTFSYTNAQGQQVGITDQEMLSVILTEFYQTSQVMIGQAISVSELNAFLKEKQKDLSCIQQSPKSK